MKPVSEQASIVLLGSFNPAIFQPSWLAQKELVAASEAEAAKIQLVSPQLTDFQIGSLQLQVLPDRFFAGSTEPQDHVRLRDLVEGIFLILAETPLSRMGINFNNVYRFDDQARWNALAEALAPKRRWQEALGVEPRLSTVQMVGRLPEGTPGTVNVKLESGGYPQWHSQVNNDIHPPPDAWQPGQFVEFIRTHWETARADANRMISVLLEASP